MFAQIICQNAYLKNTVDEEHALVLACRRGDINLVQKLLSNLSYINHRDHNDYALIMACYSGNLDLVKYLWPLYPNINTNTINECFITSAHRSHVEILSFILNTNSIEIKLVCETLFQICQNNSINVVKFIVDKYNQSINREFFCLMVPLALKYGNYKIVKFILKLMPDIDNYCANTYPLISGDLITTQYLTNNLPDLTIENHTQVFLSACANGHFDTVIWLKTTWPEIDHRINNDEAFINTFGKIGYTERISKNQRLENDLSRLQLLRWFLIQSPDFDYVGDGSYFIELCNHGYVECAKYLYNLAPQIINLIDINKLFEDVCAAKYLDLAKWLAQILDLSNLNTLQCFIASCNYSNIEVVQWLHSMYPEAVNKSNEKIFWSSTSICTNIRIIKFVLELCSNIKLCLDLFIKRYFITNSIMAEKYDVYKCRSIIKYICGLYSDSDLSIVVNLLYKHHHRDLIKYLAENRDLSYVVIKDEYSDKFTALMNSISRSATIKSARS